MQSQVAGTFLLPIAYPTMQVDDELELGLGMGLE